jgi:hypothetical protein
MVPSLLLYRLASNHFPCRSAKFSKNLPKYQRGNIIAEYLLFAFGDCVDPLREKKFNDRQKYNSRDQTEGTSCTGKELATMEMLSRRG